MYQEWKTSEVTNSTLEEFVESKIKSGEIENAKVAEELKKVLKGIEGTLKVSEVQSEGGDAKAISETRNMKLQDEYGNKIVVPQGFRLALDSGTDATKGIVVEDVSNGNQFVWVPVGKDIKNADKTEDIILSRYEFTRMPGHENPIVISTTPKSLTEDIDSTSSWNDGKYTENQTNSVENKAGAKNLKKFISEATNSRRILYS